MAHGKNQRHGLDDGDSDMSVTGSGGRFWHLLSDAERAWLSAAGQISTFPAGATICREGVPETHVFVLIAGWAMVTSVTEDGRELVLALRGQGDMVGELAGEVGYRTATVRAIDTVRSLIVRLDIFTSFLDANPGADHAYRRVVTQRWKAASAMLFTRSTTNGSRRLAMVLLDLADQHGVQTDHGVDISVPLSQAELASLAGVSRATLSRALSNWRGRDLIRTGQRHITITRVAGLRKVAGR
jgi:CRP/FNR family cyclic AMP-dependent transcriptional regulator